MTETFHPQEAVEHWITEARHRGVYEGHDIAQRLRRLAECASGETELKYIEEWLRSIKEKETYSASKLIDPLLDLWGFFSAYQSQDA